MALINTLRNKMGKVVVAVIAIAIMSFVLADLLGPNSTLFGNDNAVGEIAGETISLKEFQNVVQLQESNYMMSFNRQPGEREKPTIRQQAWELLIAEYAFQKQYDKVGIKVTSDELWDMMQGKNISPGIQQSFVNPETGQFDRDFFFNFLNQLPSNPQQRARWELFKKDLEPGRERLKYENLLVKSNYVPTAQASREYNNQNDVAEVKYLYVPYYAVSDSAVTPTESQLKDYYEKNKERYKVENSRSLKYVSFDVIPSAEDSAFTREEINELKAEFAKVKDDSVFASVSTDGLSFFGKYQAGTLPRQLKGNVNNLTKGDVRGPYSEAGNYILYKVSDIYEDTVDYAKASHILIQGTDDESKAEARRILKELKEGANFSSMAAQYGTDGTKSKGGDLGWFMTGDMVSEFEKPVFNATKTGLLDDVVETEYGYHIIKVDELKTNTVYKVASIEREIIASDETRNVAFRKADLFASNSDDIASFEARAKEDSINVLQANKLKPNDRRVGSLGEARQIVQWLFKDASKNDISEVFELDESYVVAVMTDEVEKGYQSLNEATTEVSVKVKNKLKAEQIISKLSSLEGSLDEKASAYGEDANVYSSSDLKFGTNSLPSVGFDPKAVGKVFSLEAGETSSPFAAENGVLIIEMQNKTVAPEIADYSTYKNQLIQSMQSRVGLNIGEAIKENANIEDKRYKFY